MNRFTYPVTFTPDELDGGFVVTFRDMPEAITQGDTVEECLEEGAGALEAAIAGRIQDGLDIPVPSEPNDGERMVALPLHTAMRAALYVAMKEAGISRAELARQLHTPEREVQQILDPHHGTKVPTIERALSALGRHVELHVS